VVRADAVVAVPAGSEAELVGVVGHVLEGGESVEVDDGAAVLLVVCQAVGSVVPTLLPVIVKADIAVAQVAERRGLAIDHALALDHAIHDAFDEFLFHICTVEVP